MPNKEQKTRKKIQALEEQIKALEATLPKTEETLSEKIARERAIQRAIDVEERAARESREKYEREWEDCVGRFRLAAKESREKAVQYYDQGQDDVGDEHLLTALSFEDTIVECELERARYQRELNTVDIAKMRIRLLNLQKASLACIHETPEEIEKLYDEIAVRREEVMVTAEGIQRTLKDSMRSATSSINPDRLKAGREAIKAELAAKKAGAIVGAAGIPVVTETLDAGSDFAEVVRRANQGKKDGE